MGYDYNPEPRRSSFTSKQRLAIPVNTPLPRQFRNIHISMDDPRLRSGPHSVKAIATITGAIGSVEIIWHSQPVTKVPVGDVFSIRAVNVWANNPGAGAWEIKLTCIEIPTTGDAATIPNLGTFPAEMTQYKNNGYSPNIGTANFDLTDLAQLIMPNKDLRLRVRLWGYPFWDGPAIARSEW